MSLPHAYDYAADVDERDPPSLWGPATGDKICPILFPNEVSLGTPVGLL